MTVLDSKGVHQMSLILPYHVRPDTLAYLKSQPLFVAKAIRDVEVHDMVAAIKKYLPHCGEVHPESEAITFYAGNAIWAEIAKRYAPDQPLPPAVLSLAQWYLKSGSLAAQRLLHYLALIITRESRHVHGGGWKNSGDPFKQFNAYMHGANNSMHAKDLFLAGAPKMKLGPYVDAICDVFYKGHFSGGYGGHKWGVIADVFKNYVNGEFTAEMVTDVSWALCHNGGPIFNKGMTYLHYNEHKIKTVLDVQRGGQIPELILGDADKVQGFINPVTKMMVESAKMNFPDAFGDFVDWKKVQDAGAVQGYSTFMKAQLSKATVAHGGKVYFVTPDVWVQAVERSDLKKVA